MPTFSCRLCPGGLLYSRKIPGDVRDADDMMCSEGRGYMPRVFPAIALEIPSQRGLQTLAVPDGRVH